MKNMNLKYLLLNGLIGASYAALTIMIYNPAENTRDFSRGAESAFLYLYNC